MSAPQVVILSGPNGAGKSTMAEHLVRDQFGILDYINADTIARGLSAFDPESKAMDAGRYMLDFLKRVSSARADFAFETTLATRSFARWIDQLCVSGYEVGVVYIWLPSADLAVQRVSRRVEHGGHYVPETEIRRRYARGRNNFFSLYQPRANWWQVYNGGSENGSMLVAEGAGKSVLNVIDEQAWDLFSKVT